ncbi:hypothetical protein KUV51_08940 [Tateyamaria omphalii]|uniref:hypothetical protein n=1 Tax=Tateyamaria omphalii TaxID=299262 RepID=UPI001C997CD5|nr:hypothetical protein [Tateyamaria omphalii]MBY5933119.1 hypothetical protein [Tateyamaria omphalii]
MSNIIVIGDGEGDVRFWRHLGLEVGALNKKISVSGLFLDHDDLGQSRNFGGTLEFLQSWQAVAQRTSEVLHASENAIVLVDVDRTAIFPRGVCDVEFAQVRRGAIQCYLDHFRTVRFTDSNLKKIDEVVVRLTENMFCYADPHHTLCHKNEEAIAIGTLLSAVGLIEESWADKGLENNDLESLVLYSLRHLKERIWLPGLGEEDPSKIAHWNADALEDHLHGVAQSIKLRGPVLTAFYRQCEADHIEKVFSANSQLLNKTLLSAIKSAKNAKLAYLSDRPTSSLIMPKPKDGDKLQLEASKVISSLCGYT